MATKVVVCTCIIFFKLCQKAMLRFASSKKGWCNGESKSFYANTHFRYFCILDKESKALPLFASINPSSYIKINDVKTDAKAMQWVAINAKRLTFPPLLDKVVKSSEIREFATPIQAGMLMMPLEGESWEMLLLSSKAFDVWWLEKSNSFFGWVQAYFSHR